MKIKYLRNVLKKLNVISTTGHHQNLPGRTMNFGPTLHSFHHSKFHSLIIWYFIVRRPVIKHFSQTTFTYALHASAAIRKHEITETRVVTKNHSYLNLQRLS